MRIGYARVSTEDQSLNLQLDALRAAGCERIHRDKLSGGSSKRPGLEKVLRNLKPGDTLVVWSLDRLGRSLADLIALLSQVQDKGCEFRSLTEAIDTTTAGGKLIFHILGAMAEFERRLIVERTIAGLKAAKARGVRLGGRPKLTLAQVNRARRLIADGKKAEDIAAAYGVARSTVYRHLQNSR